MTDPGGAPAADAPPPVAQPVAAQPVAAQPVAAPAPSAAQPAAGPAPAAPTGTPTSSLSLGPSAEWPVKAVDAIDLVVGTVNDRAIRPLVVAARAVVFGLIIAFMATVVLVLVSVGVLRLLDTYVFPGRIWASYAVLGLLFSVVGLVAWTRRTAPGTGSGGA